MFCNDFNQSSWLFDELFIRYYFPHVLVEFLFCQKFQYFDNLQLVFLSKGLLVEIVNQINHWFESHDSSDFRLFHLHTLIHNIYFELNWVFQTWGLVFGCQVDERKRWVQDSFYLLIVVKLFFKLLLGVLEVFFDLIDVRWATPVNKIFVEKRLEQWNHHSKVMHYLQIYAFDLLLIIFTWNILSPNQSLHDVVKTAFAAEIIH